MHAHAFVLALAVAPLLSLAQERAIHVTLPPGEEGAVYTPYGLLGSLPYSSKVDADKVGRLFIVTKGLHFMEVDASTLSGNESVLTPAPFALRVPPDSIEAFNLADFRIPGSVNTSVTIFNGIQLNPYVDADDLLRAAREYLAREKFPTTDGTPQLTLIPTYVKTYDWYEEKGVRTVTWRYVDYSIIHCISWSLVATSSGQELFKKELHGGHYIGTMKVAAKKDRGREIREEKSYASRKAFISSLQCLLRDSAFIAAVRKGSAPSNPIASDLLTITNSSSTHAATIQQCLPSVVTIRSSSGFGSGFFIAADGHLLTNDHVLGPQDSTVTVTLNNGFALQANVVRRQPKADVALLRITGARMMPLRCDSTAKPTASEVYAIGTPERTDLSQTLTKGIISGHRELDGRSYIQTDVAINRGNSGGPLIDSKGNVIGVVSAKMMGVGTESLGFAIPIGEAFKALAIQ